MTIIVCSKRRHGVQPPIGYSQVAIGRPAVLGNPHKMASEADRQSSIAAFRRTLADSREKGGSMWHAVELIADRVCGGEKIALMCWCAPLPCHGDVIKSAVEYVLTNRARCAPAEQRAFVFQPTEVA